MEIQIDLPL